jgi:hypothetical protein
MNGINALMNNTIGVIAVSHVKSYPKFSGGYQGGIRKIRECHTSMVQQCLEHVSMPSQYPKQPFVRFGIRSSSCVPVWSRCHQSDRLDCQLALHWGNVWLCRQCVAKCPMAATCFSYLTKAFSGILNAPGGMTSLGNNPTSPQGRRTSQRTALLYSGQPTRLSSWQFDFLPTASANG